jgi:hypothetical protein
MNKLLEHAFAEVAKLPEGQQEAIASRILEDVEAERGWEERFAKSRDRLAELARQAGAHIADGTALPFDPSDRPNK